MKKKLYLILIFIFLIIIMINISAFAHKVNIFAYLEEGKIYTESYFSDGKKCVESKIEVFDNQGNKLLEGLTDKEGMFSFKIPPEDVIDGDLKLVLTASMGHRAEYIIRADELGDIKGLIEEKIEEKYKAFTHEIVNGVHPIIPILDNLISEQAPEWPLDQVASIDKNIIRIALWEFAVGKCSPVKVAINEAVELAKIYGSDSTPRFVNGVLGSLVNTFENYRHELDSL